MLVKVFPHGEGDGDQPTRYLLRMDYPGREDSPPTVLRGDPEMTRALIDSIDRKWKFTSGVLSWHPDDIVTPEKEEKVMDDFERLAFAGLEPDQRNILWVRHAHAGHHELHFLSPRMELASGKAFNAFPPGWEKVFNVFRELQNQREGWISPDDPERARLYTPESADLHQARLRRWGKGRDSFTADRAEAKQAIHDYLITRLEQGEAHNREEVLAVLKEAGLVINRTGRHYITVKDPDSGEKLRLKGGMYAEQWNFSEFLGRENSGQDSPGRQRHRRPDPQTLARLERELERLIQNRAEYNRNRYPQRYGDIGKDYLHAQPHFERRLQQDVPASRGVALHSAPDSRTRGLRHGGLAAERSLGLAAGDCHTEISQGRTGENNSRMAGKAPQGPKWSLHRPEQGPQLDGNWKVEGLPAWKLE
jgi:hypothetical protein